MKKQIALLIVVIMLIAALPANAWAEETPQAAQAEVTASADASAAQDNIVTTKHTAVIQGKELSYTAQAGTAVLETGGNKCEIFFTAYTLDGVEDISDRPITFAFNGGPGSCSMYLHVGCLGPRRVDVDENGNPKSMPARMVDNENSLLDLTDLVIIDAIGTGYSRSLEDSNDPFIGYDNDVRTMGDFIRQYVNRNSRWGSRKYIAGESYGTARAVGICKYLIDTYSMHLNGLVLISSFNEGAAILPEDGNEIPYATLIPTFAADAWYQGILAEEYQGMELEDFLTTVRRFVEDEYVPALFKGSRITKEETETLAEKYAAFTGLKKEYVLLSNLRVGLDDFLTELLKDRREIVGRLDGRVTGPVTGGSIDSGDNDPSSIDFDLSFGNTFIDYIVTELGYMTDRPYIPSSMEINNAWTFPIDSWGGYLSQEKTIFECMSKNPFLKVWVLCGYFDGATPFYSAEYSFSHVFLNDEREENLSFTYYPCGHMIYMEKASFDKFRMDAESWYNTNHQ